MPALLILGREQNQSHPDWKAHRYEGYRPIPVDVTAFWQPVRQPWHTGFWDRQPKRTPGRFRRSLMGRPLQNDAAINK